MAKEFINLGNGVSVANNPDGSYDVHVTPKAKDQITKEDLSSTGKSYILAKTLGGYAALGANRKMMVILIETLPKTGK